MNKLLPFTLLTAASLLSSQTFAASPKWDYVDLNYTKLNFDHSGFEPDGLDLRGVKLISDDVFVKGSYLRTSEDLGFDDRDYNIIDLGLGYKMSLNETTDWWASASYARLDIETSFTRVEENGYSIATGVRSMLTDNFELAGELSYMAFESNSHLSSRLDHETSASVQGTYYLTDNFGLNFGYRHSSDIDAYSVGVRYGF